MSYTNEDKEILKAARLLKANCCKYENSCEGCVFDSENGCVLDNGLPYDWDILSEEEEHV